MKTKVISVFLALILMLSAVIIPSTVAYAETEDTTPPKILTETLSVSHKKVITGDSVRASVVITDDSFVQEVFIFYESPESQNIYYMPMLKNINTGRFIVDMPIDNYTECGTWKVLCVAAADEYGNEIIVGNHENVDIQADVSSADFEVLSVFSDGEPPHDYRITVDQTLQLEIASKTEIKWSLSDESLADITDVKFGYDYNYSTRLYKGSCTVVPEKSGLVDVYAEDKDGNLIGGARVFIAKSTEYYKVWFDYQGGKVGTEYIEVPVGYSVLLPSSYKNGSHIAGWSRNPYASKAEFFADRYFTPDNDVKLYAVWNKPQPSSGKAPYELKLIFNDGTTTAETVVFEKSETFNLPTPQREGYTCIGWSSNKYSELPKYTCGSRLSVSSDMELYAVWLKNGPEESYDYVVEMHEFPVIEFTTFYQVKKWVSSNDYVAFPDRYSLAGDNAPIEERDYHCTITPRRTGVTEFYALDENNCIIASFSVLIKESTALFKLELDTNGGEELPPVENIKYNQAVPLPTPTREGYVCLGWAKKKDAVKVDYNCSIKFTVREDTTLYAVWHKLDPDGYQVVFDYNDESGTVEKIEVNYGDRVALPVPTRDGYLCIGWSTISKDAVTPNYSLSSKVEITEDKVFYAVWKSVENIYYNVILYPNIGDPYYSGDGFVTYKLKYGDGITLPTFQANGYTFAGWATSAESDTVKYKSGEYLIPEKNTALYGVWVNNSSVKLGDINKDGKINSLDALLVLNYAVKNITFNSEELVAADVNKDSQINSLDALMILMCSVGKIEEFK